MKQLTLFFLIIASVMPSSLAQEDSSMQKGNLEIRVGFNTFSPARKMYKLMEEYDFDYRDPGPYIIWGSPHDHPHYLGPGFTTQISYASYHADRSKIGFLINHSFLKGVDGYSIKTAESLTIRFSSTFVVLPMWKLELDKYWELQSGPAIMINTGKEIAYSEEEDKYTKISLGVFSGLSLKVWDRRDTFGKIGIQYLLATPNKMGPYTSLSWYGGISASIPESRFWFGHMVISFNLGFHTNK